MKKNILMIALAAFVMCSCQTKKSAINDLHSLNQELQINSFNYTIKDWKDAGERYVKINKRITKHAGNYTNAEVKDITETNGQIVRSFTEGAVTKVAGAVSALKSFVDGFKK